MTRREAEQLKEATILQESLICLGSLSLKDGRGKEVYKIIEFSIVESNFKFKCDDIFILKRLTGEKLKLLVLTIKKKDGNSIRVRCYNWGKEEEHALEC